METFKEIIVSVFSWNSAESPEMAHRFFFCLLFYSVISSVFFNLDKETRRSKKGGNRIVFFCFLFLFMTGMFLTFLPFANSTGLIIVTFILGIVFAVSSIYISNNMHIFVCFSVIIISIFIAELSFEFILMTAIASILSFLIPYFIIARLKDIKELKIIGEKEDSY